MGEKFPAISSKELVKILEKKGFQFIRQSGTSHAIYKRFSDKRRVLVANAWKNNNSTWDA